jgi:hypothetical protein
MNGILLSHMRTLTIGWLLSLATALPLFAADANPIYLQQNSQSPDGRLEILIEETGAGTGQDVGIAHIRDRKTGKSVGTFDYWSFGVHPDTVSIKVLWRPDSRYVAVWWQGNRGYTACSLYTLFQGKWVGIPLPDYIGPIRKMAGRELHTRGSEIPQKWLPGNRLLIEVSNVLLEKSYEVTLDVSDGTKTQKPKARVRKIEEFSEGE